MDRLPSADEAAEVLGTLLGGDRDVLRCLWTSYADPLVCPVEPRPWDWILSDAGSGADGGILALMIDTRRW